MSFTARDIHSFVLQTSMPAPQTFHIPEEYTGGVNAELNFVRKSRSFPTTAEGTFATFSTSRKVLVNTFAWHRKMTASCLRMSLLFTASSVRGWVFPYRLGLQLRERASGVR